MNLRRVGVLISKELIYGSKNLMFIFAVVIPLALSLILSLLVGTLFSGKPRLGVADLGSSQLPGRLAQLDYVATRTYDSAATLKADVQRGALDVGLVLPAGLDSALQSGQSSDLELYVWGESLLKNRTVLAVTISREIIALAGRDIPVQTVTTLIGDKASVSWQARLFPLLVAMAIILGGTMIPSTALVEEKEKRTLTALAVTPATMGEIKAAKSITGALVSVLMGAIILTLNRAWGAQPAAMLVLLALSATLSAGFGLILGTLLKDMNTLFTAIKGLGLLLYAPALIQMFPQLPQWVARLFPTYYMINPIVEMSLHGAGWRDIAGDVAVLCVLIVGTLVIAGLLGRRREPSTARLPAMRAAKN
jgi:ABC-2 type transport system permease protein